MNEPPHADWQAAGMGDSPVAQIIAQPFVYWIQGMKRLQKASTRFIADRVAKELRLPQRLVACATPLDAFGIAADFVFETARDYVCGTQNLFAIAAGDFQDATAAVI